VPQFAIKHGFPTISGSRTLADAGLLLSFGPALFTIGRGAASYENSPTLEVEVTAALGPPSCEKVDAGLPPWRDGIEIGAVLSAPGAPCEAASDETEQAHAGCWDGDVEGSRDVRCRGIRHLSEVVEKGKFARVHDRH
jgi:hypothetical protein